MSIQYLVVSMELWTMVCTIKAFVAVCFARKSERPMLNTIIRTSNSERPIPRHNRICLVRSPMRSLVPAEPSFCRSAFSRACSRTPTIRTCRAQYMRAKMSNNRRRACDCHTTLRVPSTFGARGRRYFVHPHRRKLAACAAAFADSRFSCVASMHRPSR